MVRLLYFGKLADVSGQAEESLKLPADALDSVSLRQWLDKRFGTGGEMLEPTVRIAVDGEIVLDPYDLRGAREIALMPPVGGG